MIYEAFKDWFSCNLDRADLPRLTDEQLRKFYLFTGFLLKTNEQFNLTAIRDEEDVVVKHYIDSLFILDSIPVGSTVLDMGCGAGFPSIPLAISRSDLHIVALDSTEKKVRFVNRAAELLQLPNLQAIAGRAEDLQIRQKVGQVDVVVSRAMARMNILSELSIPYLKIGGKLVAMKGLKGEEEMREASYGIRLLGGGKPVLTEYLLLAYGGSDPESRTVISVPKLRETPPQYPRPYKLILKNPL